MTEQLRTYTNPDTTTLDVPHSVIIGEATQLDPSVFMAERATVGDDVHIGRGTAIGRGVQIENTAVIGSGVLIGAGVGIGQGVDVPSSTILAPGSAVFIDPDTKHQVTRLPGTSRELNPEPKPVAIIKPEVTINSLLQLHEFNIAMWTDTYMDEGLGITRDWIRTHLDRTLPDNMDNPQVAGMVLAEYDNRINNDPDKFWRVAVDGDGAIAGYIYAHRSRLEDGTVDDQHLESLFIRPDYQGTGLAKKLVVELEESWRDPNASLTLEVATFTEVPQIIYKKWGFEHDGEEEHKYAEVIPMINMVLPAGKHIPKS